MITGNEPAMPIGEAEKDRLELYPGISFIGLTIRQQFASRQMAAIRIGLMASCKDGEHHGWSLEEIAREAIADADALIAELNKQA